WYRAARTLRTPLATPPETTTSMWHGTRSAGIGRGSPPGWTNMSTTAPPSRPSRQARETPDDLHVRRDDDRHCRARAAGSDDVFRRHRFAERGCEPGSRDARTEPCPHL